MADLGRWKAILFETRSGIIVNNALQVLTVPTFGRRINAANSITAKVLVGDSSTPGARTLDGLTREWFYSLAVDLDGFLMAFGAITDSDYDDDTGELEIGCIDMWGLLGRRELINPSTPPSTTTATSLLPVDTTRDLVYTGLSKADIAVRLVSDSCSRTGFDLPIDFPAIIGGTEPTRTYPVYDLADVAERVLDLTQESGGPDIDWQAYYDPANAGHIRYQMRVGTPLGQTGTAPVFDYGSSVTRINVRRDGSGLVAGTGGVYVKGNSTERASQVAYAGQTTLPAYPALDAVDSSRSSVTDPAILQGYATANLAFDSTATVTWTCTARVDAGPRPSDYLPGTSTIINVRNHRRIADGTYAQRVLGWTDDQGNVGTLRPILQAVQINP